MITTREAAIYLQQGELVALPTETVYGLACNGLNQKAVHAVFTVKGRPFIDPLILHVDSFEQAQTLAHFNEYVLPLASAFWPGPLTLLLPKKSIVLDVVTAGKPSVALRMPQHPLFREVLSLCQVPLAAPSANPFGYISPTRAEHVRASLGDKVPHILDGGPCAIGVESTILDLTNLQSIRILRQGPITAEAIEAVLKRPVNVYNKLTKLSLNQEALEAPGLLSRHYSPKTKLQLIDNIEQLIAMKTAHSKDLAADTSYAYVFFKRPQDLESIGAMPSTFWLTENGNLMEAAQQLFHLLHILDKQEFKAIYIEKSPEVGVGKALNDRLARAALKH